MNLNMEILYLILFDYKYLGTALNVHLNFTVTADVPACVQHF